MVMDGEQAEHDVEVAVDTVFLSLLKGWAMAFVPFCTFFFRDAALPEREDLVEEAAVDFSIRER